MQISNFQLILQQKQNRTPRSFPCANCKIRSISPPKAVICIRSGRRWWWSRSVRRWRSCRRISSDVFCLKTPTIYGHNIPLMPDKTPHQSFVIFAYTVLLIGFSLGEWGLKGETLCFFLCRQVLAFRTLRIQRQPETARLFMNPRCLHTGYPLGGSGEYSADGFAHRAVYCCGFCNISVIFRKFMPL